MIVNKIIIIFLLSCSVVNASPSASTSSTNNTATDARVVKIEKRISKVETSLKEKSKKDNWDKLSSISGILAGFLLAFIGAFATFIFNRQQRMADEKKNERELAVQEIQLAQGFLPYITSDDPVKVKTSLLAIETLNSDLARQLALNVTVHRGSRKKYVTKQSVDFSICAESR